ncbi:MAG: NAD(P)-dependent oxidoreductase [Alphaproteobacteria bacterium]
MPRKILITDSLFVFDEHVAQMKAAGFDPTRLDKVKATEAELVEAISGCEGYILGGVEQVTEPVIRAGAGHLKVISFTGADYGAFIPVADFATQNGIAITNCPGANASAVAEFALTYILMLARRIPQLTMQGGKDFYIADEFSAMTVGVLGYGFIGQKVASMLKTLGFRVIVSSRSNSPRIAQDGLKPVTIDELVTQSDVLTIHVDKKSGAGLITASQVNKMKSGAGLVNTCDDSVIDSAALLARLARGEIFFAGDHVDLKAPAGCPAGQFIKTNASIAFNTRQANKLASDWATQSVINLMTGKDDPYIVNPEYKKYAKAA